MINACLAREEGLHVPTSIDRSEVQRLIDDEQATLVEALPREDFEAEHITGAVNLPIKEINAQSIGHLDKDHPIILYCWDTQ
jgi:rhodanese-related sulfurtransferase